MSEQAAQSDLLAVAGISKRFGVVQALDEVSFSVRAGEVHAICGENGAGKSTLVKILMGVYQPDAGEIRIADRAVHIGSPRRGQSLGIALVSQELSLAPDLDVEDNIWLGSNRVPFFHRSRELHRRAAEVLASLGMDESMLSRRVSALSLAERQLIEIARNLCRESKVLILDEPTATLSDNDIERLFIAMRGVREQGHAVVYITHRLGEVFEICDRVTVLRNGRLIATHDTASIDRSHLIEEMIGGRLEALYPEPDTATDERVLDVRDLSVPGALRSLSFNVAKGQILGIAGQIGSGANEITRALAGLIPGASGALVLRGNPTPLAGRGAMLAAGIEFVSEDRAGESIFAGRAVAENLLATRLAQLTRLGMVSRAPFDQAARNAAKLVGVDPVRLPHPISVLSGGNQQKTIFGRFLDHSRTPEGKRDVGLILMNEPTRGVDVGARSDLYQLMREYCKLGFSIVMYSTDLEELLGMSDEIITLYRGEQIGRYTRAEANLPRVLADITHAEGRAHGAKEAA